MVARKRRRRKDIKKVKSLEYTSLFFFISLSKDNGVY
jgi:hypothetical protein